MEPTDFFKTAELLKNEKDECHWRSSISRSYYAVHLYIRDFISKTFLGGIKFKNDPHEKLIKCLEFCDVSIIRNIGIRLKDLRQARTDADYHIDKKINKNKSGDVYDDAKELKSLFDSTVENSENRQRLAKSSQEQAKLQGLY